MHQVVVEKLFEIAPQLGLVVLFLVALGLLLKEYRVLRTEMKQSVDDAVGARLGSVMGNLQIESSKASQLLDEINTTHTQAQDFSRAFQETLTQQSEEFNKTFEAIDKKLSILRMSVPKEGELKYSARDLAALAQDVTSAAEAIDLINQVTKDPDATSKDLEVAGDVARKFRRFSLALDFYRRASELDPENSSAKTELLALLAETDAKNRTKHLTQLTETAVGAKNLAVQRRVANTLIELDRYDDLAHLSQRILEAESDKTSPITVQAYRDLGVAAREQRKFAEAAQHFRTALLIAPDDENLIKAYIGLLRDTRCHDEALSLAKKLVTLDALNWYYHLILAREYVYLEQFDRALQWFDRAELLVPTDADRRSVQKKKKEAILLKEFKEEDQVSAQKALEATLDSAT